MELLGFDIFTHYRHYHRLIDMICVSEHRELRTVCLLRVPKPPFQRALSPLSVCDILKGFFCLFMQTVFTAATFKIFPQFSLPLLCL